MSSFREKNHTAMDTKSKSDNKHLENISKGLNKARQYIIILLTYFFYKLTQTIVLTFQKFTWAVTGVEKTRKDAKHGLQFKQSVHVQSIFWRRKFISTSMADPSNFITTHKAFKHPNYILKPTVSLYCMTKDEVIFVEVPEGVDITGTKQPRTPMYIQQFQRAHSLITMPLPAFHKIAHDLGNPRVPIIWISNTGHCGSTMLVQMFAKLPGMLVMNSPDVLTTLAFLEKNNNFEKGEYEQLLPGAIRILCKPDERARMICVKTRPCCTIQMGDVYKNFPHIYQLYVYRNSLKTIASSLNIFGNEEFDIISRYILDSEVLSTVFPCFRKLLYNKYCSVLDRTPPIVNPKNMTTASAFTISWAANIATCLDFVEAGVPLLPLLFEDMMRNPRRTCSVLFDHLEIRQDFVDTAMEGFKLDTSKHPNSGQSSILPESRKTIPHDFRVEADSILKKFGLPKLGERYEIPGLADFETPKFNRDLSRDRFL
ncbi:uncharacterized protein LOC127728464 [Mytilus californianus]|uniref:uncharacterized protein LOC127728464 n=1 Tax=Mytilus californianus TaxID=6549 RepID=UPI002248745A|nr:uncharacterized protein LOC127728464 [Mytilus californianus]XP_052091812.1 uncharacterized protein LOC127728464 [Mytilus californianus]XP_052091813.1 uncharacterized protein LOC127728464 [Mytilus californianus]